jgi:MFS family permease
MISLIIGPPIGGLLLNLDGMLGLQGWRWMFVVEAVTWCRTCWCSSRRPADRLGRGGRHRHDQRGR